MISKKGFLRKEQFAVDRSRLNHEMTIKHDRYPSSLTHNEDVQNLMFPGQYSSKSKGRALNAHDYRNG